MKKSEKLYIVKSSTFKGTWVTGIDNEVERVYRKRIYADRYLGIGDMRIIQMNGMNYDRNKLLVFRTKAAADNACTCANATLRKLAVIGEQGTLTLNDYKVIEYKPRKSITKLEAIPMFGGTAYRIVT